MILLMIYITLTLLLAFLNTVFATTGYSPWLVNFSLIIYMLVGFLFCKFSNSKHTNFLGYKNDKVDNNDSDTDLLVFKWRPAILVFLIQLLHLTYLVFLPIINQIISTLLIIILSVYLALPVFKKSIKNFIKTGWKKSMSHIIIFSL